MPGNDARMAAWPALDDKHCDVAEDIITAWGVTQGIKCQPLAVITTISDFIMHYDIMKD